MCVPRVSCLVRRTAIVQNQQTIEKKKSGLRFVSTTKTFREFIDERARHKEIYFATYTRCCLWWSNAITYLIRCKQPSSTGLWLCITVQTLEVYQSHLKHCLMNWLACSICKYTKICLWTISFHKQMYYFYVFNRQIKFTLDREEHIRCYKVILKLI